MELIYKLMKIQVLIVAVISSFILYGCEDNEADYLELSESSFGNVSGDGATLTVNITSGKCPKQRNGAASLPAKAPEIRR